MKNQTTDTPLLPLTELQAKIAAYIRDRAWPQRSSEASLLTQQPVIESCGYVLGESVRAEFPVPRHNLSAMDGYALAEVSGGAKGKNKKNKEYHVVGESLAGRPFTGSSDAVPADSAVRIMTGALVPSGYDRVVMQEQVDVVNDQQGKRITLHSAVAEGENIRFAGEEIQPGETLLEPGTILQPKHVSLLATLGHEAVQVYRPLRVGLLATGDELVNIGEPLTDPSYIYNSNTPTLKVLLANLPVTVVDYGIVPDDLAALKTVLTQAAAECDVVVSSAGVSVGDHDFLTEAIAETGAVHQYKVAMKPGKPFLFGHIQDRAATKPRDVVYFGLPGNPLSNYVGAEIIIKPALGQLAGAIEVPQPLYVTAVAEADIKKRPGRRDFQRGVLRQTDAGDWRVAPMGAQDSHRVKSLARSNCLLDIPQEHGTIQQGETVRVLPFLSQFY